MTRLWCSLFASVAMLTVASCSFDWDALQATSGDGGLSPRGSSDEATARLGDGGAEAGARGTLGLRICSRTIPCYFDEYCDYPDLGCGLTPRATEGVCRPRPESCAEGGNAECGCDGFLYTMACEAHRAGMDTGSSDACAPDASRHFACGDTRCVAGEEYCLVTGLAAGHTYECKSFGACEAADCSCPLYPCLGSCVEVAGGGTMRNCSL